jgi:hypothetical protein
MLYEASAKFQTSALQVVGMMRTFPMKAKFDIGLFMYGPETVSNYLSYMVIRISSTHFPYCQPANSSLRGRTDVSKYGIMGNAFRQSRFRQFRFGVFLFNRMEISFVGAVTGKYGSSRVTRLDLHRIQIYVNLTKKWPIQPFHKNP